MSRVDRLVFFVILIASLLALLLTHVIFSNDSAPMAVIEVDGKEYGQYLLEENDGKILEIRTEFGYNKIVFENKSVRVTESTCPDGLEVHAGAISKNGQMLVCLPNRLVIRITGRKEVDGFAY